MAAPPMQILLRRTEGARYEARNASGHSCLLDGPPEIGGQGEGMRPMEMLLVSLAGCSAVDVQLILQKGRHRLDELDVEVQGYRADAVPAVFTDIEIVFRASGDFDEAKLQRAADLSMEKYCSVAKMLSPTVQIAHRVELARRPE